MSMTHAMCAIIQDIQRKLNSNSVQKSKHNDYDDYGDYNDGHGDYYDFDNPYSSEGECHGDYNDVHGDYYDFDFQEEEVAVRPDQSVKSPMPNIPERIKNRSFQKTK